MTVPLAPDKLTEEASPATAAPDRSKAESHAQRNLTLTVLRGIRCAKLPSTVKIVAVMICMRSGSGRAAFPAVKTISADAGLGVTATSKALKVLEHRSLLVRKDRPGRSTLYKLNEAAFLNLATMESEAAKEARAARKRENTLFGIDRTGSEITSATPPPGGAHPTVGRGPPPRQAQPTPAPGAGEMPKQIPTEIPKGKAAASGVSAAAAPLVAFGMNSKQADQLARDMAPGEAEHAVTWCRAKGGGPGLIVACFRDGDRPWNAQQEAPPNLRPEEILAYLDSHGGAHDKR